MSTFSGQTALRRHDSLGSTESISTNATISDKVGAGRGLSRLYDAAGSRFERRVNRVVAKLKKRGGRSSISDDSSSSLGSSTSTLDANPTTPGLPHSVSETSLVSYTTGFTLSTNATLPGLVGAGRLIGKIYDASGQVLETRVNALATQAGFGPDACLGRIKGLMREASHTDSAQLAAAAKRSPKKLIELMLEKQKVTAECERLLRYARSAVSSTRSRALQHITTLAIEDPFLQSLFVVLGAEDVLKSVQKDVFKYVNKDEGLLLSRSRKALICLSRNEVNTIVQKSLRSEEINTTKMLGELSNYIKDPETSFLALRHLRRTISLISNSAFPFGIYCALMSRLASLMYSMPHLLEWECVDDIVKASLESLIAHAPTGGLRTQKNIIRWGRLFREVFRNADRMPKTIAYLISETDVDNLINPNLTRSQLSKLDYFRSMDGTLRDPLMFNAAAFYPRFILNTGLLVCLKDSPLHSLDSSIPSLDIGGLTITDRRRLHATSMLVGMFPHPSLKPLWKHLEYGPNLLTAEIMAERFSSWNRYHEMDCVVPKGRLTEYCELLKEFLSSTSAQVVSLTIERIKFVLTLDRYCWDAMYLAISKELSHGIPRSSSAVVPFLAKKPSLNGRTSEVDLFNWFYRHESVDGRIHIRKWPPFSRTHPCKACLAKDTWNAWLDLPEDSPKRGCAVFRATKQQILLLEVLPGEKFDATGHEPVLAGINEDGVKEYLSTVCVPVWDWETSHYNGLFSEVDIRERSDLGDEENEDVSKEEFESSPLRTACTVREGEDVVEYLSEGEKDCLMTTSRFWVFVLRGESTGGEGVKVGEEWMDVTGECRWEPV